MKVMVVNPPWVSGGRKGVRAGSRWPHLKLEQEERYMPFPFYMAYATALLKRENILVQAIDAVAEDLDYDEFKKRVKRFSPDLLVSEVSTPSMMNDLSVLHDLKEDLGCLIGIAGPDINIRTEKFMQENGIDLSFIGEYERSLLEVARAIESDSSLLDIKGIVFKHKGKIISTGKRAVDKDIDGLPWPDRTDFLLSRYHDCPGGIPEPSAQMWASRGCPYACKFCAWPQIMYHGSNYRARDVLDVADEMEYLVKKRGMKSIYFDDDTFNIGKKRMMQLAIELIKRDFNTPWAFMGRADLASEDYMKLFKKSGLKAVKYGMESGSQEIVDSAGKNLDLKTAIRNIEATKNLGIKVHLTFTLGLPGETRKTINETIRLALRLDPDSVQFSIATPFPGTKFYEEMKAKGSISSDDWSDYDGNSGGVLTVGSLAPADLKVAQDKAYKAWENHRYLKMRYAKISPIGLFSRCLRENGLSYTIRKSIIYIRKRRYEDYYTHKVRSRLEV
jgi:anaerobic magnesium-protoporphyrin IX monomethyl ester cyclase